MLENLNVELCVRDVTGLPYYFVFPFEKAYQNPVHVKACRQWMESYWWSSIIISIVYIVLIYIGQKLMQRREKFDLRLPLVLWNISLASFSIFGTIRTLPELLNGLWTKNVEYTVCNVDNIEGITGNWIWLFALSKVPELFDTAFIVLRKQKLIFLHWFHHATVLIYTWYSYHDWTATGRWFCCMNFLVHAFMYSYYACRAMRFKIPRKISMSVTVLQLSQMVVGCYVNGVAYTVLRNGGNCHVSYDNIKWSFFMYFAYFVLFAHFFINAYYGNRARLTKQQSLKEKLLKGEKNGVIKHHMD